MSATVPNDCVRAGIDIAKIVLSWVFLLALRRSGRWVIRNELTVTRRELAMIEKENMRAFIFPICFTY